MSSEFPARHWLQNGCPFMNEQERQSSMIHSLQKLVVVSSTRPFRHELTHVGVGLLMYPTGKI